MDTDQRDFGSKHHIELAASGLLFSPNRAGPSTQTVGLLVRWFRSGTLTEFIVDCVSINLAHFENFIC